MNVLVPRHRRAHLPWTRALAVSFLGASLAACSGNVVDGPGLFGSPEANQGAPTVGAPGGKPDETRPGAVPKTQGFEPAPAALRKLTVRQYQNTVRALFGADAVVPTDLEPDTSVNGFFSIGAAKSTVSPSAAEKLEAAAYALAARALDASHRQAFVGCTPAGTLDAQCSRSFVERFGRRAFRRPLTSEEVARYVGVAESAQTKLGDFHAGLEFAVAGLLQSPHFVFRAELGQAGPTPTAPRPYDDYEMASRLSYLLWNTTPDDALLEAAARGELTTLAGLQAQAERLLADPRAKVALDDFHVERLSLDELDSLEKDSAVYSGLDDGLRAAMRDDVLDTIEEFTFGSNADFRELFSSRVAFVDSKLAALYGAKAVTKPQTRVELPADQARVGLLGKVALLAINAHANVTSPTKRGKYIRERLLCTSIPAPPPEVVTVLPEPNPSAPTMRDRLQVHAESAACAGCHVLMDPLGLSLEHFDAVGRFRADDKGHALDVTGDLDGKPFDGSSELATLLHDDERTSECVARQVYRYATAHVETDGEAPAIDALIADFAASGFRFTTLLRDVVLSDGFRYGAQGQ